MTPTAIIALARSQYGLVSRDQALRAGLSRGAIDRKVRCSEWESIGYGVYRLPGAPPTWHQRALALCLGGAPDAVTSHATAGWLWSLDGISREAPEPIDLLLPHGRELQNDSARVRRTRAWEPHFMFRSGIPVTLLSRTLLDLASELSEERLEQALDSGLRQHGTKLRKALTRRLEPLHTPAWPGLPTLRKLMAEREGALDSALEVQVQRLIWASGLPKPAHNFHVYDGRGWVAKVDFAWPKARLILQAHGLKFHLSAQRFRRDQEQQSNLEAAGWRVLTTTWEEVERKGVALIDRLQRAYALSAPAR